MTCQPVELGREGDQRGISIKPDRPVEWYKVGVCAALYHDTLATAFCNVDMEYGVVAVHFVMQSA